MLKREWGPTVPQHPSPASPRGLSMQLLLPSLHDGESLFWRLGLPLPEGRPSGPGREH